MAEIESKVKSFHRPKFDKHASPWFFDKEGRLVRDEESITKVGMNKYMKKIASRIVSMPVVKNNNYDKPELSIDSLDDLLVNMQDVQSDLEMLAEDFEDDALSERFPVKITTTLQRAASALEKAYDDLVEWEIQMEDYNIL